MEENFQNKNAVCYTFTAQFYHSSMALQPGQFAPDFTLYNSDKQEVSLKNLQGNNVVLLFFPVAYTPVCTTELCSTRDNLSVYNDLKAQVYGISVDSPFTLDRFKKDLNLNFPLLSDFNKEASTDYGALYETFAMGMKGVSKRAAFVIDKEGTLRYTEVLENANAEPDYDAIRQTLESLQ